MALLVHPFSLHFFFLESCWIHTPADWTKLEHCGYMNTFCNRHADENSFMGCLWHPSCQQFVFTMINSGVLIMLVVECLADVGCGCKETLPLHTKPTMGHVRG